MRGAAERGIRRRRPVRARGLAIGIALGIGSLGVAVVLALVFVSNDRCRTVDRRLGLADGPEGWAAEARYQRWDDGYGCRARTLLALYAPGDTWEDEALEPTAIAEVPASLEDREASDALVWSRDRIVLEGPERLTVRVHRLPRVVRGRAPTLGPSDLELVRGPPADDTIAER